MTKQLNLQDVFLNSVRKEKIGVTVFLTNGFQFKGFVKGFDSFIVILDCDGKQQLVFKHAISTIIPARSVNILNANELAAAAAAQQENSLGNLDNEFKTEFKSDFSF